MAFIDPAEAQSIREALTEDLSQLGKLYKAKNSEFQHKSVDHSLVESMLLDGWEDYTAPLKTKTKLRKAKTHDVLFEDDIWCQLHRLGYRKLNIDRTFRLPFGKASENKKQIDIIAINEETILLIECKSSAKPSRAPSFKDDFEGLKRRLDGFAKSLEQVFGPGRRIKYIFATRNLRMPRESSDTKRLSDAGGFLYNDNTYEYIEGLIKHYRDAALYQFMALIFRGQSISKNRIEVPAIEGTMGGKLYYMFSLEPHLLLKMGFVLHRTRANEAEMPTYQRLLIPSRLKSIEKFIENGKFFPNSIVLNFDTKHARQKFEFQPDGKKGASKSKTGTLKIPNAYAIAYIIDGQHRVYGYANTSFKDTNTIPVVAFRDLTSSNQLELFMEINENQKAVSPTLRITLEEDLLWDSTRADFRMKALRSAVISELGGDANGPLYGKISLGEDRALLQAKPFATSLLRCGLLPQAKGNKYEQDSVAGALYDTNNHNHNAEMRKCRQRTVSFLNRCYEFAEEYLETSSEVHSSFILSNRGTYAFVSLLGSLNSFEASEGNIKFDSNFEERFDAIQKYLQVLFDGLSNLSEDQREHLFVKLGTGADTTWFRSFQEMVNAKFSNYEPLELVDWKERQDQELQNHARNLTTSIERHLKATVISKLKELFGVNWDIEIGPIQRECETRAREQMEKNWKEGLGRVEIPWTDQFNVNDYKKIIEKYWTKRPESDVLDFEPFESLFAIDIGLGFNSKADKTKWLSLFSSYRNTVAHEGTKEKGLNHEEVGLLESIHNSLSLGDNS